MDKQGKIAVALAILVIVGWTMYQQSIAPPPKPEGATPTATPTPALAGATPQPETIAPETVTPAPSPEPALPEVLQRINSPSVDFIFTNHGGGIAKAQLNNHFVDQNSVPSMATAVSNDEDTRFNSNKIVLNEYGPVPIGAISDLPGQDADASYTTGNHATSGNTITYERATPQQIQITKKFTLPTATDGVDQYIATLDLSITNRGDKPYTSDGYYIYLGSAAPIHARDYSRYICLDWYLNGAAREINVMSAFNASRIPLIGYELHGGTTEYSAVGDNIRWAGVYNQYFTSLITPGGDSGANRVWANRLPVDLSTRESGADWLRDHPKATPTWYAINGALGMPGFVLKPGEARHQQFKIYLGPRQYQLLSQLPDGQSAILQFGHFGFVSKFLLVVMIWLKGIVGSYAVAIILLTIAIKGALWPLQNRSTKSMKKMQALSPKMTELREKFKDDPSRLNQETIKLYKTYGVNPLAGCLPMVIQLPIFFGFYTMLGSAIELRNSKFFWVHDLSQPDTVGHIPGLGWAINVLPLCMAATSVWMTSMTPKSGDSSQQKMMMFMPLIFLGICYNYASGLALYFMVSNLCTVLQYYVTKKQTAPVMISKKKR